MSWKSIIVHIRPYEDWSESTDVAIRLAKQFGTDLTGLYTLRELAMLKQMFGEKHAAVREAEARDTTLAETLAERFRRTCKDHGVACRWEVGEGNAQELLSLVGRCHDLIVVEQSQSGLDGLGGDTAEECAVASGTPTLIVPRTGRFETIGKRVVVAWNHSRQAAAALHAAIPLIQGSEKVVVLRGHERDAMSSITRRPAHDIADYLRKHAAEVDVAAFDAAEGDAGVKLLSAAQGARGDVLVMGAYGRSSWREFLFGGATRHVIANMNIPVLMAH